MCYPHPRPTGADAGISREALRPIRENYAPINQDKLHVLVDTAGPAGATRGSEKADDLQFGQIVCRTSSYSTLFGGTRVLLCSRQYQRGFHTFARTWYQPGCIGQWGHYNNTIFSCLDHKVGGNIDCRVLDARCNDKKNGRRRRTRFVNTIGGAAWMRPRRNTPGGLQF